MAWVSRVKWTGGLLGGWSFGASSKAVALPARVAAPPFGLASVLFQSEANASSPVDPQLSQANPISMSQPERDRSTDPSTLFLSLVDAGAIRRSCPGGTAEPSRRPPSARLCASGTLPPMCRNIRTLFNFAPPATDAEVRAAALQFVRKLSGTRQPSKANAPAFEAGIEDVFQAARRLIDRLVPTAPPRDRIVEALKAKERSKLRVRKA